MRNVNARENRATSRMVVAPQTADLEGRRMEEWRPVTIGGLPWLYAVSDHGRVMRIAGGGPGQGRLLAQWRNHKGYPTVFLRGANHSRNVFVHRLVAEAFIGHIPAGRQVNHRDGRRANNRASNLEYVTQGENMRHAYRLGLQRARRGEASTNAKLTADGVRDIRQRRRAGEARCSIGRRYGIDHATVRDVEMRRTWAHVD